MPPRGFRYDVALIELQNPINWAKVGNYRLVNGICLPKENISNSDEEYAIISGFGVIDNNRTERDELQMGWTKMSAAEQSESVNVIENKIVPFPNGTATCMVSEILVSALLFRLVFETF